VPVNTCLTLFLLCPLCASPQGATDRVQSHALAVSSSFCDQQAQAIIPRPASFSYRNQQNPQGWQVCQPSLVQILFLLLSFIIAFLHLGCAKEYFPRNSDYVYEKKYHGLAQLEIKKIADEDVTFISVRCPVGPHHDFQTLTAEELEALPEVVEPTKSCCFAMPARDVCKLVCRSSSSSVRTIDGPLARCALAPLSTDKLFCFYRVTARRKRCCTTGQLRIHISLLRLMFTLRSRCKSLSRQSKSTFKGLIFRLDTSIAFHKYTPLQDSVIPVAARVNVDYVHS
jgi:hypothetical protein